MNIGRFLFIFIGVLLGMASKEYLVGVYSIICQSILWIGIIVLIFLSFFKERKENS